FRTGFGTGFGWVSDGFRDGDPALAAPPAEPSWARRRGLTRARYPTVPMARHPRIATAPPQPEGRAATGRMILPRSRARGARESSWSRCPAERAFLRVDSRR